MVFLYKIGCANRSLRAFSEKRRLVEGSEIFWHTFFEIVLEWAPILKHIYEIEEIELKKDLENI